MTIGAKTLYYQLSDDQKVCIAFVLGNYTNMIVGFQVAEQLSFQVVNGSLTKALKIVRQHPDLQPVHLIADGGSENHNTHIDEFVAKLTNMKLTKIRALKDIRFSNSPVEAIHRW